MTFPIKLAIFLTATYVYEFYKVLHDLGVPVRVLWDIQKRACAGKFCEIMPVSLIFAVIHTNFDMNLAKELLLITMRVAKTHSNSYMTTSTSIMSYATAESQTTNCLASKSYTQ